MPKFFCEDITGDTVVISGEDAVHLIKALRVRPDEELTVCDRKGTDYLCKVESADKSQVYAKIISSEPCTAEPKSKITLFMALPKGDKMELIVQKAVELGVYSVVPVITNRCVSRPDGGAIVKKIERWQKIATEAAKQSGRGIIPQVCPALDYTQALSLMGEFERRILFYEQATAPLGQLLKAPAKTAVFVGPEGGFDIEEIDRAKEEGIDICTLGPRILRCETAPLAAISIILACEEIL